MGVAFQCGRCGKSFDVGSELAGKAGLGAFRTKFSPINLAADLKCPLYLFQARDDGNTPTPDADHFVSIAKGAGKAVRQPGNRPGFAPRPPR